jgi:hypothetical protein
MYFFVAGELALSRFVRRAFCHGREPPDMDTFADLLARGREREGAVIDAPDRTAPYSYHEFSTNAWKAGNLLRHYGVRAGATVAVLVGPKAPDSDDEPGRLGTAADPLLAILGGGVLGALVDLTPVDPIDARAVVLPNAWVGNVTVEPGCSRLAYGGPPEDHDVVHFEREVWSENPIEPPDPGGADDPALRVDGETYTQADLLAAADDVAESHSLGVGDVVALDASLADAGAFAAGVLAPLSVGATIFPGDPSTASDQEAIAYVVRSEDDGAQRVVDPASVL